MLKSGFVNGTALFCLDAEQCALLGIKFKAVDGVAGEALHPVAGISVFGVGCAAMVVQASQSVVMASSEEDASVLCEGGGKSVQDVLKASPFLRKMLSVLGWANSQ